MVRTHTLVMLIVSSLLAASAAALSVPTPALPAPLPSDPLGATHAASLMQAPGLVVPDVAGVTPVETFLAAFAAFDAAARAEDADAVMGARVALLHAGLGLRGVQAEDIVAPPVMILRFSVSDDVYDDDVALIYDAGGNDVYTNNAGGSGIMLALEETDSCAVHVPAMAAALFDMGGDDRYGEADRGCGTVGGGVTGAGFLYDASGNDVYTAANDGTIGGGSNGIGFLLDGAGDDRYAAGGWGTNGGGYPGAFGMLLDLGGDDLYTGTHDAVNGGGLGGSGFLYDATGNDVYYAWGSGVNGGAAAGRGLLWDVAGDDWYGSQWSANANGGATGGIGLLRDQGGLDFYWEPHGETGWDLTVFPKETNGAQLDE